MTRIINKIDLYAISLDTVGAPHTYFRILEEQPVLPNADGWPRETPVDGPNNPQTGEDPSQAPEAPETAEDRRVWPPQIETKEVQS